VPICYRILDCTVASKNYSVFISQNRGFPGGTDYHCFFDNEITYFPYCDDFGPMNLAAVVDFIGSLDDAFAGSKSDSIVYCTKNGRRSLTNAAFLLGAYMMLKLGENPKDIQARFDEIPDYFFENYRDATYSAPSFRLGLIDCWSGLYKAMSYGWLDLPLDSQPQVWGMIDMQEYKQYEDPLNADLHEVVPGKFVAFQGPNDLLGGQLFHDDPMKGARRFSPSYYIEIFRELDVTTVLRLNEPHYNSRAFTAAGIAHHDLYFVDCTAPPPDVVIRFLAIVEAAPGVVAVHCQAGLGRTGTLIALYLMRSLGFTAREAMGWLRIMRPGCVIGEQQQYLCEVERKIVERFGAHAARPQLRKGSVSHVAGLSVGIQGNGESEAAALPKDSEQALPVSSAMLAEQVAAGMLRRGAARLERAA
jgi:cell division cycle 14